MHACNSEGFMYNNRNLRIAVLTASLVGGIVLIAGASAQSAPKPAGHRGVPVATKHNDIETLLTQVRKVLVAVKGEIDAKKLPSLKSVQLNLQTGTKKELDGSIGIFIVTLGGSTSNQTVQTLNITLA